METLIQDLRYGFRMLAKKPLFALIAIATLALGIGANTAIFSVVNGVILNPLGYPEPQRLLTMRSNISRPNLIDAMAQNGSFESAGGVTLQVLDYTGSSEPVQIQAGLVAGGLFEALGAKAALGRGISIQDDQKDAERIVVLSHKLWQARFAGDEKVLDKTISLSGQTYTIVGVMPAGFVLPESDPELFAPLMVVNPLAAAYRGVSFLRSYWRLKPDVTAAQAQSEMTAVNKRLAEAYPEDNAQRQFVFMPLQERIVGRIRPILFMLFGAVSLVLLIACANFANLLLGQAASRQQEMTVRMAIGASRIRLARQMLTESLLLSLIGGAVGLLLAMWGVDLLIALKPDNLPRLSEIGIDKRVLLFTLSLSTVTGLLFGLLPAYGASRSNLSDALKDGGRTASAGILKGRLRGAIVVAELSLSLLLLVGAGLLIKSFGQLRAVKPGFDHQNILTMRIELPESRYKEIPKQTQFRTQLLEKLNTLPGVEAAMASELPLSGEWLYHDFIIDGRPPITPGQEPELHSRTIAGDYFRLMNIPILKGRDFNEGDREGAPQAGIINEAMARRYFENEDPLGKRIRWARMDGPPQWMTIVGVAADVKHFALELPDEPAVYFPYAQLMQPWKRWMSLTVKSNAETATLAGMVKAQLWSIDSQLPIAKMRTMSELLDSSLAAQRFNMLLLGIFAAVALALALVGIYGVISHSVAQRTHEIGIRMALGAQTSDVIGMVLKQGLLLAVSGAAIGLAGAYLLTKWMSSVLSAMLYEVSPTDPATFALISAALIGTALTACFIPARRAAKVDPMTALRYE